MPNPFSAERATLTRSIRLARHLARGEFRSGGGLLLGLLLLIATTVISLVDLLHVQFDALFTAQARQLLGGDLVLESSAPLPAALTLNARQRGLLTTETVETLSVLTHRDRYQLASLSATKPEDAVRNNSSSAPAPVSVPATDVIWITPELALQLDVTQGEYVQLGTTRLLVERLLVMDEDNYPFGFSFAPSARVALSTLKKSGLLGLGSHTHYRLLLNISEKTKTPSAALAAMRSAAIAQRIKVLSPEENSLGMKTVLERLRRLFNLIALSALLLTALGIAMSAHHLAGKAVDRAVIMQVLGATNRTILLAYVLLLLLLVLMASACGLFLGAVGSALTLDFLLRDAAPIFWLKTIPAEALKSILLHNFGSALLLVSFALAPLGVLGRSSPQQIWRNERAPQNRLMSLAYLPALGGILLLIGYRGGSELFGAILLALLIGVFLVVVTTRIWLYIISRLTFRGAGRVAFSRLVQHPLNTLVQTGAIGASFTLLFVIALVRFDMLASWQQSLRTDKPNHFVFNVQPTQLPDISTALSAHIAPAPLFYPMVKMRLITINETPISQRVYADDRSRQLANRIFNLSAFEELPDDNRITQGRWWAPPSALPGAVEFSVEEDIAHRLGIRLGDQLRFASGETILSGTVASLRAIAWDSNNVNFFVVATPGSLHTLPTTHLASFHLMPDNKSWMATLARNFPGVTVVDLVPLTHRLAKLSDRIASACGVLLVFTLFAGLLVLAIGVWCHEDERRLAVALLSIFGAKKREILKSVVLELGQIAGIAIFFAIPVCLIIGYWIARTILHIPYHPHWQIWGIAAGGCWVLVVGVGLAVSMRALKQSSMTLFRQ